MAVISASEAKEHLNIDGIDDDAEVEAFIARAEAAIARHVGPLEPTSMTSRVPGGLRLLLPVAPVASLSAVVSSAGVSLPIGDLHLDQAAGVVEQNSGAAFPARYYVVTYSAGRATLPDDLKLAVLELVRHFWDTQRGSAALNYVAQSDSMSNTIPGAAYTLPFRVTELIAPHLLPGIA